MLSMRIASVSFTIAKRRAKVPHLNGPRGGHTAIERTVAKGEVLPPTPEAGRGCSIAERAHNMSGHNPKKIRSTVVD